jgi:hypothetical protein
LTLLRNAGGNKGAPINERIDTIIAFQKAGEVGAKAEGSVDASTPQVLAEWPTWS